MPGDEPRLESRACVTTTNGARYIRQLCRHWAHRFEVAQGEADASVALPQARLTMHADADALQLHLAAGDPDGLAAMQDVVASHVNQFAFREAPLAFEWR